ncbi:MAG TPA: tetratricopeptide repeat protein [Longimicrobiales bacterium]
MKLRDVDSAETAFRLKAVVYGIVVAAPAGVIAYLLMGSIITALLGFVTIGAMVTGVALYIADRGGSIGASLYRPSGSSTPAIREYSYADSLVARGQHDDAVAAYARLGIEHPADPEPRIRQARVLRDRLQQYDAAVGVFRQVLLIPQLKPATELVVLREIIEIHVQKQQQPERALPYLARIAQKFAGNATAEWARSEARDIKAGMKRES